MKTLITSGALALALTGAASAATVNIDNFDTTNLQVVGAPSLGVSPANPSTTSGPTSDAIGGFRTLTVERLSPVGTSNAFGQQVQAVVKDSIASVSLGPGVTGTAEFSWNAGGADLVDGTNGAVLIDILTFDQDIQFALAIDGVSVANTASVGTLEFLFADFAGVDLTNVSAISLLLSGPVSFDVQFDNIRAGVSTPPSTVPLPAGGLLILGGLGALGALRARRKV